MGVITLTTKGYLLRTAIEDERDIVSFYSQFSPSALEFIKHVSTVQDFAQIKKNHL